MKLRTLLFMILTVFTGLTEKTFAQSLTNRFSDIIDRKQAVVRQTTAVFDRKLIQGRCDQQEHLPRKTGLVKGPSVTASTRMTKSSLGTKPSLPTVNSLIQVVDSIYGWSWESSLNDWMSHPDHRSIDVVYDNRYNLLRHTAQNWDGFNWTNVHRYVNTYDSRNNLLSETTQDWYAPSWYDISRWIYTYDAANNLLSETYESWGTVGWDALSRYIYTYDSHGNELSYTHQDWIGNGWQDSHRAIYTYDTADNLLTEVHQNWSGTGWDNLSKTVSIYDQHNNKLSETHQSWDGIHWSDVDRLLYYYDSSGNLTETSYETWSGSFWYVTGHIIRLYDSSNQLISETMQSWQGGYWNNDIRMMYSYDGNGNMVSERFEVWENNQWILYYLFNLTYDTDNFLSNYSYKSYDSTGYQVAFGDSTSFYFHTVIGINELAWADRMISLYPNPTSGDVVYMKSVNAWTSDIRLSIYSSDGRLLRTEKNVSAQKEIDVRDLPAGSYLLVFRTEEGTESHRLVVGRSE